MAHFAKLDENNIVTEVLVVNNDVLLKTDGTESEYKGKVFLNELFGSATWIQTSFNKKFRGNFAGVGFKYDETNDVFLSPKPFDNWILNEEGLDWIPPLPIPDNQNPYYWDQENNNWVIEEPPFESWQYNIDKKMFESPIPYPYDGQPYEWNEEDQTWDLMTE